MTQRVHMVMADVLVDEGGVAEIRVSGGRADKASSVNVYLVYNTAAAADLDLKTGDVDGKTPKGGLKFPLTLSWARGEIGERVIAIPAKADNAVEADEFFTLQIAAPNGQDLGDCRVCTVTVHDPGYDALAAKVAEGTATKAEQSAWDRIQKARAPYVRGLADPADGGKVSGSGPCAAGRKVTLKAAANRNFTFLGWRRAGADPGSGDGFVATTASLVVDRTARPAANSKTSTTIIGSDEDATYYAVFRGDPEISVYVDATDGSGSEPTGKGAGRYVAGTITGIGRYAPGRTKVVLRATANKGYVFAGWIGPDGEPLGMNAAYTVARTGDVDVEYTARFVTAEEDKAAIALSVDGAALAADAPRRTNAWTGVYLEWPVAATALSATTVRVAGLPAGLKFAAKDIMKKGSKTEVDIPANTIYGAPTAASRTDKGGNVLPSKAVFTVTTAGRSTRTFAIDLFVDALPAWAVGSFDGLAWGGGGVAGDVGLGTVSLAVAANGKVSGKLLEGGRTWVLAATSFGSELDGIFSAEITAKVGKETVAGEVVVSADGVSGRMASEPPVAWGAWQNLWKRADAKAGMPVFKKSLERMLALGEAGDADNTLKLTFRRDGAVAFAGKIGGVGVSGTSQLVLAGRDDPLAPMYQATLYAPPKAKFAGWCGTVAVRLVLDDLLVVEDVDLNP